jgi:hypothetical protein
MPAAPTLSARPWPAGVLLTVEPAVGVGGSPWLHRVGAMTSMETWVSVGVGPMRYRCTGPRMGTGARGGTGQDTGLLTSLLIMW